MFVCMACVFTFAFVCADTLCMMYMCSHTSVCGGPRLRSASFLTALHHICLESLAELREHSISASLASQPGLGIPMHCDYRWAVRPTWLFMWLLNCGLPAYTEGTLPLEPSP